VRFGQPKLNWCILALSSGGNNFIHFAENQLIKFNARDSEEFNDVAGEWEMAPKCGSLPLDEGDLVGLMKP